MTSERLHNKTGHFVAVFIFFCVGICFQPAAIAGDKTQTTGDILQIIIPSVAYGATFFLHDQVGRGQFYQAFFTNFAATQLLKYSVHKKRPNGSEKSFPSGHTSAAFQGAAFIHKRYGLKYAVPAYIAATFVGYSRVESRSHYTEDVVAGALIGIASSFYFATGYKGFLLTPIANNGSYGVVFSKQW